MPDTPGTQTLDGVVVPDGDGYSIDYVRRTVLRSQEGDKILWEHKGKFINPRSGKPFATQKDAEAYLVNYQDKFFK